jgi:hypothetical protein
MSIEEKLAQAEADLQSLIHRARNALPTLFYIIEDTRDWRRDVRATIHRNLLDAVEEAEHHQIKRKRNINESPPTEERLLL